MDKTAITNDAQQLQKETPEAISPQDLIMNLSGKQLRRILFISGYTFADFARYIKRSNTFANRTLCSKLILPYRYGLKLSELVTLENLEEALHRIHNGTMNKYLSGREMRRLIIKQGYTFKEVADFMERSGPFVSDVLGSMEYSIPLRYLDGVKTFLTPEVYEVELEKIRNNSSKRE